MSSGIPTLKHLGLGSNGITDIKWFHPDRWHSLASLDLSKNNLSDLQGILVKLRELKFLRSLFLAGNPLAVCYEMRNDLFYISF